MCTKESCTIKIFIFYIHITPPVVGIWREISRFLVIVKHPPNLPPFGHSSNILPISHLLVILQTSSQSPAFLVILQTSSRSPTFWSFFKHPPNLPPFGHSSNILPISHLLVILQTSSQSPTFWSFFKHSPNLPPFGHSSNILPISRLLVILQTSLKFAAIWNK